jgi:sugar phosphate isomerase/epimerase
MRPSRTSPRPWLAAAAKVAGPRCCAVAAWVVLLAIGLPLPLMTAVAMEPIRIGLDDRSFALGESGARFIPWGFNYDRDDDGRLLEDYWKDEWPTVQRDFLAMRELGANVVRIHLQFGKFMNGPEQPNAANLERLGKLLDLAEEVGLYLNLTGLGCYHRNDVPEWYDALSEPDRWEAQARFWAAVAARCAGSPAVFCYNLMNEPVVPGQGKRDDWLGPAFAGKHYVQFIVLDLAGRARSDVARAWITRLTGAIREHDPDRLITVGLVHWSLDRPGLTSGFVPDRVHDALDFIAVHLYPEAGKVDEAIETLEGFDVGKPIVIEEIFPLRCSVEELDRFLDRSREIATGWIGFYWGKTPEDLRASNTIRDVLTREWLELFRRRGPLFKQEATSENHGRRQA